MRIGIDARTIYRPELRGIGKTLADLLEQMWRSPDGHEFVLYYERMRDTVDRTPKLPFVRSRGFPANHSTWWEQVALPQAIVEDRCDIFHSPSNTTVWFQPCPVVVTVHDLIGYERSRQEGPIGRRFDWRVVQPGALRRARRLIAVSKHSKREVMQAFGIPEERIRVIPHGIHPRYKRASDSEIRTVLQRFEISQPYIFVAGGETARKNLPRVLEAMRAVWQRHPACQLVISGVKPPVRESLFREHGWVAEHPLVKLLAYVSEPELIALYSGAIVFLYASLSEGFGLPPLEAMACGVPVVASKATSIPEAVGDGALLVDATRAEQIAEGLLSLLDDERLRKELVERGRRHLLTFSWETAAKATLQVYREAAGTNGANGQESH